MVASFETNHSECKGKGIGYFIHRINELWKGKNGSPLCRAEMNKLKHFTGYIVFCKGFYFGWRCSNNQKTNKAL